MLLLMGFGTAGCLMALLLASNGVLVQADDVPVPHFTLSQSVPEPVTDKEVQSNKITLPCRVPGTSLKAVRLSKYEGPFQEDGSNRNVFHTAALEVENLGSKMVRNARIVLDCGSASLLFEISFLPPGATVLALEREGKGSTAEIFSSVSGKESLLDDPQCGLQNLKIQDVEMGITQITNLSDRDMDSLTLYYKATLGVMPLYIGGITHSYQMPSLKARETATLNLPNYAMGYSRIVAAEE